MNAVFEGIVKTENEFSVERCQFIIETQNNTQSFEMEWKFRWLLPVEIT